MVWVKSSDDFMLDERIQAVDCCADSALRAAYEVCNRIETDGVFHLGQLMTRWSPAKGNRRRLRKAIEDLISVRLVHRLEHAEALRRYTMAVENGHQFGFRPVKSRHYFQIVDYLEDQPSAEEKRLKKQDVRDRKRRQRESEREGMSRVTSRPPDPDPVPELRINDLVPLSDEPEPPSTASPSEPSSGTADRDDVSWLRTELDKRRAACGVSCKGKPEHQMHLEAVVLQAFEAEGDTFKILTGALDGFFADPTQLKYRYSPAGLAHGFDKYAAPILEQEAEAFKEEKRAKIDAKLEAIDAAILAKDAEKKAERKANGKPDERGAEPVAIAELVPPIGAKLGRT